MTPSLRAASSWSSPLSANSNIGISSIGTSTNSWGTAFIHDAYINTISTNNISVSGDLFVNVETSTGTESQNLIPILNGISTVFAEILGRISALEKTAITRNFDIVTPQQNTVTIDVDLSNNDSLEISITFRFYGTVSTGSRLYAYYTADYNNNIIQFEGTVINIVTQEGTQNEIYRSGVNNEDHRAMLMYYMNTNNKFTVILLCMEIMF